MKRIIQDCGASIIWSISLFVFFVPALMAQSEIKDTVPRLEFDSVSNVYLRVEKMPVFPGGDHALFNFLAHKIKYPALAREDGIEGLVILEFLVDKSGKILEPKIVRGIGGGCDEEALRVVKLMSDWIPGYQNGEAVTVRYTLPISYRLTSNN